MYDNFNELYIEWEHRVTSPRGTFPKIPNRGNMSIHMDVFFPCTMEKFKKVLKIVEMDNNHDELKAKMKLYFQHRILHIPDEVKKWHGVAIENKVYVKETTQKIKDEKAAAKRQGVAPNLFSLYDSLDYYREKVKDAESEAKRLSNSKATFEKYIALIS